MDSNISQRGAKHLDDTRRGKVIENLNFSSAEMKD